MKHYCDRLDMDELLEVGPHAAHLDDMAALWSMEKLTDGLIPKRQVRRLVDWTGCGVRSEDGRWREVSADNLAEALVDAKRWKVVDGGYEIVDYLERQESAAKIRGRRAKDSERKSKGIPRGVPDGTPRGIHSEESLDSGGGSNGDSRRPKEQKNGRTEEQQPEAAVAL